MENIQNEFFTKENVQAIVQELAVLIKPIKEYLTVDETSEYLGVSKSAVYKITSKKEIPFYNPGGKKIYFKKSELDAWIDSGRVSPDSEILQQFNTKATNPNTLGAW